MSPSMGGMRCPPFFFLGIYEFGTPVRWGCGTGYADATVPARDFSNILPPRGGCALADRYIANPPIASRCAIKRNTGKSPPSRPG